MFAKRNRLNPGRPRTPVLRLERLEDRCCPSGASINVAQGVMSIKGDGQADAITISDNGQGTVSATIASANGQVLAQAKCSGINSIKIEGGGGNDTINYALTGTLMTPESFMACLDEGNVKATLDYSAGVSSSLNIAIGGGTGNDTLTTTFGNLSATANVQLNEILAKEGASTATATFKGTETVGATIGVTVDGGQGANQVVTNFGNVTGATVDLQENLGTGSTSTKVNFGTLSGATVDADVDGGTGNHQITCNFGAITNGTSLDDEACLGSGTDSYTLNLTGGVSGGAHAAFDLATATSNATVQVNAQSEDVGAGSSLDVEMGGSAGVKTLGVNYGGQVNGALTVNSWAGGSTAAITENITINQGSKGTVSAKETGGTGADTLTLDLYDNSGGAGKPSMLSALDAAIIAFPGNKVFHTPNVSVVPGH